jgi:hypothetical protein
VVIRELGIKGVVGRSEKIGESRGGADVGDAWPLRTSDAFNGGLAKANARDDLVWQAGVFHQGERPIFGCSVFDQTLSEALQDRFAHEHHERPFELGESVPIAFFAQKLVAFHDADFPRKAAMREWDERSGASAIEGTEPRNDFERNLRRRECQEFFATATKDEGISALEANHALSRSCMMDEQSMDRVLNASIIAASFAHEDGLGLGGE